VAAVIAVAAVAALSFLPLRGWAESLTEWIEGLGPGGVALFAAIYVLATLLLLPAWVLSVAAGAVFGIVGGFLVVYSAAMAGAIAAFLIARHGLKARVRKYIARNGLLRTVDKALRRAGWKVIALMRLSPLIPFTVQNYVLGVTTVKFAHFAAGTFIGIIPGTLVEVALGATGRAAAGGGPAQWTLLGLGVAATIAVAWYIGRAARRKLGIRKPRSGRPVPRRPAARART
jgi:uncharacterized membrane protein YdjX (TVP38/TMEM64 family)